MKAKDRDPRLNSDLALIAVNLDAIITFMSLVARLRAYSVRKERPLTVMPIIMVTAPAIIPNW